MNKLSDSQRIDIICKMVGERKLKMTFTVESDEKANDFLKRIQAKCSNIVVLSRSKLSEGLVFVRLGYSV